MADPKVKVVLTIDGKQYEAGLDRADGKTEKFSRTSKATAASVSQLRSAVKLLAGGFAGIKLAGLIADINRTGVEFEALENKLKFATGGSEQAADAMSFVREEANRLGLELTSTAGSYGTIAAAAKGTALEGDAVRQVFLGVAEASTALSLSSEQSEGALLALSQMISKGTVQAEELRGQLGERIPGAFQIAARAMGVTTAEMGKMLEQGQVMADDFLPRFAAEMRRTFGQAAVDSADSARAQFNRLRNAVTDLKLSIGAAGLTGATIAAAEELGGIVTALNMASGAADDAENSFGPLRQTLRIIAFTALKLKNEFVDLGDLMGAWAAVAAAGVDFGPGYFARFESAWDTISEARKQKREQVLSDEQDFVAALEGIGQQATTGSRTTAPGVSTAAAPAGATGIGNAPGGQASLEQQLQRQLALYGQTGEAAKVRYEVEQGSLANLSQVQKDHLIDMADELEFRKANDAAMKEAIATQNEAIEVDRQFAEAKRQAAEAGLQAIEQAAMTERERENQRYQEQLDQLKLAEEEKIQTLVGYDELRVRLEKAHNAKLVSMTAEAERKKRAVMSAGLGAASNIFSGISALMQREGKKQSAAQKVLARAAIIMSTAQAIMNALAVPPYPLGLALAVGAGLQGALQLSKVGGGGGSQMSAVSSPRYQETQALPIQSANPYSSSASANTAANTGGTTVIEVAGRDTDTVTLAQMGQIWEQMQDAIERGDRILFRRDSAQGLELTEAAA